MKAFGQGRGPHPAPPRPLGVLCGGAAESGWGRTRLPAGARRLVPHPRRPPASLCPARPGDAPAAPGPGSLSRAAATRPSSMNGEQTDPARTGPRARGGHPEAQCLAPLAGAAATPGAGGEQVTRARGPPAPVSRLRKRGLGSEAVPHAPLRAAALGPGDGPKPGWGAACGHGGLDTPGRGPRAGRGGRGQRGGGPRAEGGGRRVEAPARASERPLGNAGAFRPSRHAPRQCGSGQDRPTPWPPRTRGAESGPEGRGPPRHLPCRGHGRPVASRSRGLLCHAGCLPPKGRLAMPLRVTAVAGPSAHPAMGGTGDPGRPGRAQFPRDTRACMHPR